VQTKSSVKFIGHICSLPLSGSDIQFLGTTGPEPELEPDSKNSQISSHPEPEPDIRYIPIKTGGEITCS